MKKHILLFSLLITAISGFAQNVNCGAGQYPVRSADGRNWECIDTAKFGGGLYVQGDSVKVDTVTDLTGIANKAWVLANGGGGGDNWSNADLAADANRIFDNNGFTLDFTEDIGVNGITVGIGNGIVTTNTAIGLGALDVNARNHNTAIGRTALWKNTIGVQNTANGANALQNNTIGINNTATGTNALIANIDGGSNTANGTGALSSNTTGGSNTAIGVEALKNSIIGDSSTVLGAGAGRNATGSRNILIGFESGENETGSDIFSLDNSSTINPLFYGNFESDSIGLNGDVAINANAPVASAALDVNSTTKGLLPPRMTEAERDLIGTPAEGLVVYNLTNNEPNFYDGLAWHSFQDGAGIYGGLGTVPTTTVATLTDNLTFTGGEVLFKSGGAMSGTFAARFRNSDDDYSLQVRSDGCVWSHGKGAIATNTTYGIDALDANTSGFDLVAIGKGAMGAHTTGGYSVAVGSEAMALSTDGYYDVCVGYQAGYSGATVREVTAVGYQALKANLAWQNSAFGYLALTASVGGALNAAFGNSSLKGNTSGSHNSGFGASTLSANSTGTGNTAIGSQTFIAVTGSNNTGVGYNAGSGHTSGDLNTFIGYTAGQNNVTGATNTIVGYGAGINATGSNNAFYGATSGQHETGSNYIYLDVISRANEATGRISSPLVIRANATLSSQITSINGILKVQPMTVAVAGSITAEEGMVIFVSDTDATWTSIGLWQYANGAWAAL